MMTDLVFFFFLMIMGGVERELAATSTKQISSGDWNLFSPTHPITSLSAGYQFAVVGSNRDVDLNDQVVRTPQAAASLPCIRETPKVTYQAFGSLRSNIAVAVCLLFLERHYENFLGKDKTAKKNSSCAVPAADLGFSKKQETLFGLESQRQHFRARTIIKIASNKCKKAQAAL